MTYNEYFRAGFVWGLGVAGVGWLMWSSLNWLYVNWLKVRQFFEPTKRPGKVPMETGPSMASLTLGCLGRVFTLLLVLASVIVVLFWMVNPGGG